MSFTNQCRICVRLILVLFIFLNFSNTIHAQSLKPRQQEILDIVLNTDGYLTQEMHQEFWGEISFRNDPTEVAKFRQNYERGSILGINLQKELWESAKLTLQARQIVKSLNYDKVRSESLEYARQANNQNMAEKIKSNDLILEAAAIGKALTHKGSQFYITPERVSKILAGLESAEFRIRRLGNPEWSTATKEYVYPKIHGRILWEGPFISEQQETKSENGRIIKSNWITYKSDNSDYVGLYFFDAGGQLADPKVGLKIILRESLALLGMKDISPRLTAWRGSPSVITAGALTVSNRKIYISARAVNAPSHNGAWVFLAVSENSVLEAMNMHERLEEATQLD